LLGVKTVIRQELRTHPPQQPGGGGRTAAIDRDIKPQRDVTLVIERKHGERQEARLLLRLDTPIEVDYFEVDYYENGGILPYVPRRLLPHTTSTHAL